ncbi:hypothetical protein BaRGS_00023882 [Batillaria attramentaria]|uniref:Uncharacterized protein n=1 Tax=Batillaria attramentaria TaxID=370345 RepID=A0ABD0KCG0_9CAEN
MAAFTARSGGYKAGVFLLFFASVMFAVGFATPYWMVYGRKHVGLWMTCLSDDTGFLTQCSSAGLDKVWEYVVLVLESLCVAVLLAACVIAGVVNFCVPRPRSRFDNLPQVLAVTGGKYSRVGMACIVRPLGPVALRSAIHAA